MEALPFSKIHRMARLLFIEYNIYIARPVLAASYERPRVIYVTVNLPGRPRVMATECRAKLIKVGKR